MGCPSRLGLFATAYQACDRERAIAITGVIPDLPLLHRAHCLSSTTSPFGLRPSSRATAASVPARAARLPVRLDLSTPAPCPFHADQARRHAAPPELPRASARRSRPSHSASSPSGPRSSSRQSLATCPDRKSVV